MADVAVIGVADARWSETPVAVVVLEPEESLTLEALIAPCRQRIAHYKCPTQMYVVEQLPRNPTGKVLRKELRADQSWRH